MAFVVPNLLQPHVINDKAQQLVVVNDVMQKKFGMQKGGRAVKQVPLRTGSYDVLNPTRRVPNPNRPGAPAITVAPQVVGNTQFAIPRINNMLPLLGELLNQIRPIGGPVASVDSNGEQYILEQQAILRQEIVNWREFQIMSMLKGSYTWSAATASGSMFGGQAHAYSGGSITINYQIPSGNKSQLNMLAAGDIIGTTWLNAAAPIITDLYQINQAFIQLYGVGLREMWINSVGWANIAANTQVQAQAGTANRFFEVISREEGTENFTVKLNGIPWLTIYVSDNGLGLQSGTTETFTSNIPDTGAIFLSDTSTQVFGYYECSEPVVEWAGMPMTPRFGEYYWAKPTDNPAGYEMFNLMNGLPILKVPKAVAFGTVVF